MRKIVVVDCGSGNIRSAEQSLKKVFKKNNFLGEVTVVESAKNLSDATHIILPGQGAFKSCMNGLKNIPGMIEELSEKVLIQKAPFLGICVGMQLLSNMGYENGEHKGLGWIDGEIKKIPQKKLNLPHMGWNEVKIKKNNNLIKEKNFNDYYFVHSYFFDCYFDENIIATTNYGLNFASIVSKENIYGVQFHPEKSSSQGLRVLENFIKL